MSNLPSWYAAALLALAAYRCWRLAALDTVTERLRTWLVRLDKSRLDGGLKYRYGLAGFIQCPWCLGFWVTVGWWLAWLAFPHATLLAATPFALSALVGLVAKLDG